MRRRPPSEFRRPARRRLSGWIWWLLAVIISVALLLFLLQHQHQHQHHDPILEITPTLKETPHDRLNFTQELLGTTSFARQLADQMTLAKAYVIIAKEHSNLQLAWQLSSQIRNCQRLLSQAAVRGKPITLEEAHPIVSRMSHLIYKAQDSHYDISTTVVTLKSHAQALEERAHLATVQSTEFAQLAAESMPKSLHCVNLKLTEEWFRNPSLQKMSEEQRSSPRLVDNNLYHFCILSDNVLATSVVVNSTVYNSDHPQQLVFHVVTDRINYKPMMTWLFSNDFEGSTVNVRSIEEFSWFNASYSPLVRQLTKRETRAYYFGSDSVDRTEEAKFRNPKFALLLNHLRFYLPEIHPCIEKVVFLDDDVVVQKDLTHLFSLDLHGNVNGAVETCLEGYHRFHKYLNFSDQRISSKLDRHACAWAFGMNIFDLVAWKKSNVTARYHYWQEENVNRTLWKTGTLPAGLLAFHGLIEPLDRRWHVLGLGYDLEIDDRLIESAAVVHYNGNMKPWLKLAITRYRHLWSRYVTFAHPFLRHCMMQ